jgi:hypothetical protein
MRNMGHLAQKIRAVVAAMLALGALALAPSAASAFTPKADTDAPAGAAADWLPHETWVGERWMPFDETVLERRLHMSATEVWTYLSSTGNTLETLARSRHVSTKGLAAKLVANRHLPRSSRRWRRLHARTQRVLDQAHLSAHMFGHVFHVWAVTTTTKRTLGVTSAQFQDLYGDRRLSFAEVAAIGGLDEATLRDRVFAAARASGARGVAAGALSPRQNAILRARDEAGFASWANYRAPGAAKITRGAIAPLLVCHLPAA